MKKELKKLLHAVIEEGSAVGGQVEDCDCNNVILKAALINMAGDTQMWVEVLV